MFPIGGGVNFFIGGGPTGPLLLGRFGLPIIGGVGCGGLVLASCGSFLAIGGGLMTL
jgi:hypothetical protein